MAEPKIGVSKKGEPPHYSVGAVIRQGNKFLLIDRLKPPFGFAGVAGHIDENEDPETALKREVLEESGLMVIKFSKLFEEELDWNECGRGIKIHHWHLYECGVEGEIKQNLHETKSIGWYTKEQIEKLTLEPVWKYWFTKSRGVNPFCITLDACAESYIDKLYGNMPYCICTNTAELPEKAARFYKGVAFK